MDPRGIQPGTAIVTWLKRAEKVTKPAANSGSISEFLGAGGDEAAGAARESAERHPCNINRGASIRSDGA